MKKRFFLTIMSAMIFLSNMAQEGHSNGLTRIKYNNPELNSVDLGVGLWAWPFPVDYDNDGDLDLLVNCTDKPFNGLWYFENTSGGPNPVLKPPVKLAKSQKNLQISFVNGKYIAMTPGVVYPRFLQTFFEEPEILFTEDFYNPLVKKARFNLWRQVDYDGDSDLDIIIAMDDWSEYGWDNAFNKGNWPIQ